MSYFQKCSYLVRRPLDFKANRQMYFSPSPVSTVLRNQFPFQFLFNKSTFVVILLSSNNPFPQCYPFIFLSKVFLWQKISTTPHFFQELPASCQVADNFHYLQTMVVLTLNASQMEGTIPLKVCTRYRVHRLHWAV